jgi:hypothetical protein
MFRICNAKNDGESKKESDGNGTVVISMSSLHKAVVKLLSTGETEADKVADSANE